MWLYIFGNKILKLHIHVYNFRVYLCIGNSQHPSTKFSFEGKCHSAKFQIIPIEQTPRQKQHHKYEISFEVCYSTANSPQGGSGRTAAKVLPVKFLRGNSMGFGHPGR